MTDIFIQDTEQHTILEPHEIRAGIARYADMEHDWVVSSGSCGRVIGAIAKAIKSVVPQGSDIDWCRHLVIGYLTIPLDKPLAPVSSKRLTDGQWIGFIRWHSERLLDGSYRVRPTFSEEVVMTLYRARSDNINYHGLLPMGALLETWKHKEVYQTGYRLFPFDENDNLTQIIGKEFISATNQTEQAEI